MNQNVAVITGASSGLGRALALQFAQNGTRVYAIGRNQQKLAALCSDSGNIVPLDVDIATDSGRKSVLQSLAKIAGIQYLVHAAALVSPLCKISDLRFDEFRYQWACNTEAPLFLTQCLLEKLNGGRVLFVSSEPQIHPVNGASGYCISKAGLQMVQLCYKNEISEQNTAFGIVSPGVLDTPMQAQIRAADASVVPASKLLNELYQQHRLLSPEQGADFLHWILTCSEQAEFSSVSWDIYNESHTRRWQKRSVFSGKVDN